MKRSLVAPFAIFSLAAFLFAPSASRAQTSVQIGACRDYVGLHVHVPANNVNVVRTNVINGVLQCYWQASARHGSVTVAANNNVLGWTVFRDVSPEVQAQLNACGDYAASRIHADKNKFSVTQGTGVPGYTQAEWSGVGHKGTCSVNGQNSIVNFHQTQ